ncbi:MAG TPA: glutathione S-transferase, partial [Burkholderiales bacterium]|nr:glutathione S-transferase [Burkholderiales bacterium]
MLTVYGMADSGNCYKVKLALEQLKRPYRWIEVSTTKGETRTQEFLACNPNGQVPTLELEDGSFLPESGAILHYLAEDTPLWPADRIARAHALQWMFFEQYSHEPCIAVARAILRYQPPDSPRRAELPKLQERGRKALGVMQTHLSTEPFF